MRPDLTAANASSHYTEASLETAACLWEAVLDLRDHPRTDPDAIGLALMSRKACDALGTASLRMTVIGWTRAVETDWRAVEPDYPLCFDWDFVPGWVLDHVDWADPMLPTVTSRGGGMEAVEAGELPSAGQEPQP